MSKSCYNPVHRYNSSKPNKYRIDFFVLVNANKGWNFIYHIDVYQDKISTNAHIVEEAWHLPTTQKAVVNAVLSSGISTDPNGMREIYRITGTLLQNCLCSLENNIKFWLVALFTVIAKNGIAM